MKSGDVICGRFKNMVWRVLRRAENTVTRKDIRREQNSMRIFQERKSGVDKHV
jgi:hypothetical protein